MTCETGSSWIEISREREMSTAQERARIYLAQRGIDPSDLSPEVLKLDVGLDENHETYYRVRVHDSVLALYAGTLPQKKEQAGRSRFSGTSTRVSSTRSRRRESSVRLRARWRASGSLRKVSMPSSGVSC